MWPVIVILGVVLLFALFVQSSRGDWMPSGMIATPAVTSGTDYLVHGEDLFTSEAIILYVFFGIGTAGDTTLVPTDVYEQTSGLTSRTQTLTDGTALTLWRQPCREYVEVWNRTTWTVYLAPNVGLQPRVAGGRLSWMETTPTLTKAQCDTVLGPYGGGDMPVSVRWTLEDDPGKFAPFGKIWNIGIIIEDDGTYVQATELRDEFSSAGSQFIIKGH
jgi:hypothetical protein